MFAPGAFVSLLLFVPLDGDDLEMKPDLKTVISILEKGTDKEKVQCLDDIWKNTRSAVTRKHIPMPILIDGLKSKNSELKYRLISFIGNRDWKGSNASQAFQRMAMKTSENIELRQHAIRFLPTNASDYFECFKELLRDKKKRIRETTADSLGEVRIK